MGILDFFKAKAYKQEVQDIKVELGVLKSENATMEHKKKIIESEFTNLKSSNEALAKEAKKMKLELESLQSVKLSTDQMTVMQLHDEILKKEDKKHSLVDSNKKLAREIAEKQHHLDELTQQIKEEIDNKKNEIDELIKQKNDEIQRKEAKLLSIDDEIQAESYGLYKPQYDFATSLGYRDKLAEIRRNQKEMIKNKTAVEYNTNWTVNDSKAKGKKMINDTIKQILRSFNVECEAAIHKVNYKNIESIEKRINRSFEQLNLLNRSMDVSITYSYLSLKIDELHLAYEYERKKQEEKEELKVQKEKEREEKALQKEIKSRKKEIEKDMSHYQNIIDELQKRLDLVDQSEDTYDLERQIIELKNKLQEKESEKEELDYRTAHASAGYVYIISNIGAFGRNVVKIGVTRRLDPYERISELSSASVPFKFDIHALIFSYEAYQLETELHQYFEKQRINKVNNRKEFYKVSIEEIENKLNEYKELTIDFKKEPDAEEYRETLLITEKADGK